MPDGSRFDAEKLEQFRGYLKVLARLHFPANLRGKLDPSDVVQQTLLNACRGLAGFRGRTEEELAAWLRQTLVRNICNASRDFGAAVRDVRRERSLEAALDASSAQLLDWLARSDDTSPSQHAQLNENALQLADALDQLPDAQREAIVFHYWHGWSLAQIAEHLGRSRVAVAGLIKRGMQGLRDRYQGRLG